MSDTQPGYNRRDHRRLATASHDVEQQPVRPNLRLPQNFVSIDHAQKRLPLVRPERPSSRCLVVVWRSKEGDVFVGIGFQARHAITPPVAEGILISCETVEHTVSLPQPLPSTDPRRPCRLVPCRQCVSCPPQETRIGFVTQVSCCSRVQRNTQACC